MGKRFVDSSVIKNRMASKDARIARETKKRGAMNKRSFKTGDQVDALSVAGEPFTEYEAFGIRASVFEKDDSYWIPMINSDRPGSGKLSEFLAELSLELPGKPIKFVNVINQRLDARLRSLGYEVMADEDALAESEAG